MGKINISQEMKTLKCMITIFCRKNHNLNYKAFSNTENDLCPECAELLEYAKSRLSSCVFRQNKPTCAKCTIHCYRKDFREKIKKVMRFSGPKMIYTHPVIAIKHMLHSLSK